MCGIVGFTGTKQAAPILLDGLAKLEYRGYDSAGIAVRDGNGDTEIIKEKGKLKVLGEMTDWGTAVKGCCGIGHTRWATHGEPSAVNAHPHASDDENVIAVHNGIIENYQELREKLVKAGYDFKSQTDTEVAVMTQDGENISITLDVPQSDYMGGRIVAAGEWGADMGCQQVTEGADLIQPYDAANNPDNNIIFLEAGNYTVSANLSSKEIKIVKN